MPKLSLLEIVKDILNDMDSDEVNSINDTIESQQVAQIVKTCYYEMVANRNWAQHRKLIQLDSSADADKPNYLTIPENVKELSFFRYNKATTSNPKIRFEDVKYKEPDSFLRIISGRDSTLTTVDVITDYAGTTLLISNNQPPSYWTSFDDTHIVTDSYDVDVESTLQSSKTQCLAFVEPLWTHEDDFIADMPSEAFPALLEESKSTAFIALKQVANQKAEQKATRQQRWLSRKNWKAKGGVVFPNYGRTSRK